MEEEFDVMIYIKSPSPPSPISTLSLQRPFLPSSNSMVVHQPSNHSMENLPQKQLQDWYTFQRQLQQQQQQPWQQPPLELDMHMQPKLRLQLLWLRQQLSQRPQLSQQQRQQILLSLNNPPNLSEATGTIDTNSAVVKEIVPPLLLPTAQQENLDEDFGNGVEAVGMGSERTEERETEDEFNTVSRSTNGQSNSRNLEKRKREKMTPRGERRNKKTNGVRIAIPLEDILQTKKMLLKDAAKHLKVSKSTLKRVCRGYDIHRWPPRGEHKPISQSCPNESPAVVDKEQIPQLKSDTLLPSNQVSTTTGTESVTMKARFGKHTIKFQLSWPFGTEELKQQVKKRLELEVGTYYINYKDEDNDDILIGCDEDLQDHISRSSIPGTNFIEVFLHPK